MPEDIIDFNKSQFDIMVDMLVLSGMSKEDAIVKVTKDFEDEGMVLKNRGGMMDINRMTAPLGYAYGGIAGYAGGGSTELQERIDKLIIDIQVENKSPNPNYKRIDGLNNQLKYFTSLLKD